MQEAASGLVEIVDGRLVLGHDGTVTVLAWPSGLTEWSEASSAVRLADVDGEAVTVRADPPPPPPVLRVPPGCPSVAPSFFVNEIRVRDH